VVCYIDSFGKYGFWGNQIYREGEVFPGCIFRKISEKKLDESFGTGMFQGFFLICKKMNLTQSHDEYRVNRQRR